MQICCTNIVVGDISPLVSLMSRQADICMIENNNNSPFPFISGFWIFNSQLYCITELCLAHLWLLNLNLEYWICINRNNISKQRIKSKLEMTNLCKFLVVQLVLQNGKMECCCNFTQQCAWNFKLCSRSQWMTAGQNRENLNHGYNKFWNINCRTRTSKKIQTFRFCS